jgi:chloramphenicol-sensitive protein RarD
VNGNRSGVLTAIAAFFLWGVLPIFWKHLDFLPPASIVAHRTVWSLVILLVIMAFTREVSIIRRGLGSLRMICWHLLSGGLLAANWLLYVWATLNGRILEGALGYYLNPFLNMLFGVLWFGERHNRAQRAAIALALCGVAMQVPAVKAFPWVALTLALSFALYGVVKKRSPLESRAGLTLETLLLAPLALGWLWFHPPDALQAFGGDWSNAWLVIASGCATTLPLVCFGHAARNIPLTTLGILQFIGPTLQFLIGWKLYGEPLSGARLLSFALIWTAIGLYAVDALRRERRSGAAS